MKTTHEVRIDKTLAIALVAMTAMLGACASSGSRPTPSLAAAPAANQQITELTSRIEELTSQLEAARAEAESAKNLAENAQATADAAQIMAASTDDRIEQLFEKSVFK